MNGTNTVNAAPDPVTPGNTPLKPTSVKSDVVVIIVVFAIVVTLVGGLIYGLICYVKSAAKPSAPTEKTESTPTTLPPLQPATTPKPPTQKKPIAKAPAAPVTAPATLDLGRDLAAILEAADVRATGFDLKQAKVTVGKAKKDIQFQIPVGMRLTARTATNVCACLVSEAKTVNTVAGAPDVVVFVPVVGLDFRRLHVPVNGVAFDMTAPDPRDLLVQFLAFAASKTSSWNTMQAGVWALTNNISRQELAAFRLAYPDPSAPGGARQEPLASYADVKKVEAMISALGRDPDACRLIVEERDERNRLLSRVNFDKPSSGYLTVLRTRSLVRYTGDSEVERLLRQYLSQHRRYDIRRLALENLLELGLIGSPDEVLSKALWENDMNLRLVAATTLVRAGDPRGLPILAACAEDPILSDLCSEQAETAIRKQSGQPRSQGEGMLAYWTRTIGWEKGGFKRGELANAKRIVESLSLSPAKTDPALTQALSDIVSADDAKASSACYALARFSRDTRAFDALCRTALQPRTVDIRCNAINALRSFRDFSPAKTCEQIVKQGEDRLIYAVLNLISGMQFNGFENTLLLAVRHEDASLRRQAAEIMGSTGVMEGEKDLVRMAQYDANAGVKSAALYALSCMRSSEGLALCRSLLRSDERDNKFEAWRCLQVWENDPDAVELMEKYKNDPDIGQLIKAHLERFAK